MTRMSSVASPFDPFLLTPLDDTSPEVYTSCCLIWYLKDPSRASLAIQTGIDRLVSHLPFLAGILETGEKGRKEVKPSCGELKMLPMLSVKHHHHSAPPPNSLDSSYCPLPAFIPATQQRPVLRFQANIMTDALILGTSCHHSVFDGTGLGTIFEMLATFTHSSSVAEAAAACCSPQPLTDCQKELESRMAIRNTSTPLLPDSDRKDHSAQYTTGPLIFRKVPEVITRRFVLSASRVQSLKERCTAFLDASMDDHHPTAQVSSNDVFTAFLALCVRMAQTDENGSLNRSDPSQLVMAVDLRGRIVPAIPRAYLGNMVTVIREYYTCGAKECRAPTELDDDYFFSLVAGLASNIRRRVAAINDEYTRELVSYLRVKRGQGKKVFVNVVGTTIVTSWRHLKVYMLDFGEGLGLVDRMEVLTQGSPDGSIIVMPKRPRASSEGCATDSHWEVVLSLSSPAMNTLMSNPLFCWALD
ncbi:transferase family-domain-containing protein [Aspergillus arachidicola]|uniref:Transferase family-domain-containing protein n=1 Tax=Aspergillus arachidicola TaxID=656916 RepID=A0A5N6Y964_9EURO|nr:transferase family-domain-containing protein [Aspergillus arachidicola]